MKRALITGITGQDGSYLAEFLLDKGYEVHGIVRRVALEDPLHRLWRINHIKDQLHLHAGSLESFSSVYRVMKDVQPDEVYHLAAQSFIGQSFEDEFSTLQTNINGTHHVLASLLDACPEARFYFAGSSEMFGKVTEIPQREATPFHPRSAYGISKCTGFYLTQNYREAYRLFTATGILFNHESPRRGFEFVTRKISYHAALIALGLAKTLKLGNLEAKRDWGHARYYVEAMWKMLQRETPEDFVIATGEAHSVREFCRIAFEVVGLDYQDYVESDPALYRPADVEFLLGDASCASQKLGWQYNVPFESLVREMVERDLERLKGMPASSFSADPMRQDAGTTR
ncbi:MAG: GDP-mannose 4,6-dehydratase [Candidatus Omnitrophica bacterium CG11_big_fil_rev_8_21_14_0_20_63_9]|nr:MAG: GDP-mannose 4,6-dehydratase [Candidatus Omnitrophica bacterium CG11_big_fil_rev_8_21_14_0_20_63_9]